MRTGWRIWGRDVRLDPRVTSCEVVERERNGCDS
jgi:hypothetical protein